MLLIAIDALRYDHTSFSNYDRVTTPKLEALFQRQGVIFTDAWSPAPRLLPAHIALLTGCDPSVAREPEIELSDGTRQAPLIDWRVPATVPTLAEEFLGQGWHTAAFVDDPALQDRRGVDRGFRDFQAVGPWTDNAQFLRGVGQRFFDWLDALDEDENWFAYVHFNDLESMWSVRWNRHAPELMESFEPRPELDYVPPVAARRPAFFALPLTRVRAGAQALGEYEADYDTALQWLDTNLRRLITMLGDRDRLGDTTIVITGTYGLSFGESGLVLDSGTLSPVDLHVPLLLRPARRLGLAGGQRIDQLVSLTDVAPTLLALHGIKPPRGMHGINLVPLLRGTAPLERDRLYAGYGLVDGFSVITEEQQYTFWNPRSQGGGSALALSWYGDSGQEGGSRFLFDRRKPAREWLASELEGDTQGAAELQADGERWSALMESVRQVLHPTSWNREARGTAVIDDLRRRGLIGDGL